MKKNAILILFFGFLGIQGLASNGYIERGGGNIVDGELAEIAMNRKAEMISSEEIERLIGPSMKLIDKDLPFFARKVHYLNIRWILQPYQIIEKNCDLKSFVQMKSHVAACMTWSSAGVVEVRIDKKIWLQMDDDLKSDLIMHEIFRNLQFSHQLPETSLFGIMQAFKQPRAKQFEFVEYFRMQLMSLGFGYYPLQTETDAIFKRVKKDVIPFCQLPARDFKKYVSSLRTEVRRRIFMTADGIEADLIRYTYVQYLDSFCGNQKRMCKFFESPSNYESVFLATAVEKFDLMDLNICEL